MPPSARSKQPARAAAAPVKAPFSWPNSSLSSTPSANALQFTATNGLADAVAPVVQRRATSSLPVPLSPWISTVARLGATRRTSVEQLLAARALGDHRVGRVAARDLLPQVAVLALEPRQLERARRPRRAARRCRTAW